MPNRIRRWVETDTGHRVPNHSSKCRHMHGHRYRWEAELEGDVVTESGVSEEGMLIDFSQVSEILNTHIHDVVDHAFMVFEDDAVALEALPICIDKIVPSWAAILISAVGVVIVAEIIPMSVCTGP